MIFRQARDKIFGQLTSASLNETGPVRQCIKPIRKSHARLLSSIPSTQLDRVQQLQNWAARLVFQVSRDHPSQPLLNSLHWLPLKQRIIFKLLLFVYKILNNQAPKYLDTCLNLYTPTRSLRSSSDPLRLTYSVTRTLAGDLLYLLQNTGMIYHLLLDSLHQSVLSERP